MSSFNQSDIDELISCPKEVFEPPRKDMRLASGHWRNDAKLIASNGLKGEFAMFMRKNEDFPENFSIGLIYSAHDVRGEIMLLRCNGKHGDFNRSFDPDHPHSDYHVHRATQEALENGQAPEKNAERTREYASFEEALQYFLKAVSLNVRDSQKHFPNKSQNEFSFE